MQPTQPPATVALAVPPLAVAVATPVVPGRPVRLAGPPGCFAVPAALVAVATPPVDVAVDVAGLVGVVTAGVGPNETAPLVTVSLPTPPYVTDRFCPWFSLTVNVPDPVLIAVAEPLPTFVAVAVPPPKLIAVADPIPVLVAVATPPGPEYGAAPPGAAALVSSCPPLL